MSVASIHASPGIAVEPACTAGMSHASASPSMPAHAAAAGATESDRCLVELVQRIQSRDGTALACLHRQCARRMNATVLRIVRSPHLADEVIADCFWQVWRDAGRFDAARGPVIAWLVSIARSRSIDAVRKREYLARHEVALNEDDFEQLACPAASPQLECERRQRDRLLGHAFASLDPTARQLMSLAFVSGLTHRELAAHSGLALGTVKSRLRRGLATLRTSCRQTGVQL